MNDFKLISKKMFLGLPVALMHNGQYVLGVPLEIQRESGNAGMMTSANVTLLVGDKKVVCFVKF